MMEPDTSPDRDTARPIFGELADFWIKYDKLADQHDKVMLDRLNRNLDILLIFVSTGRLNGHID